MNSNNIASFFSLALPSAFSLSKQQPPTPRKFRFKDVPARDLVDQLANVDKLVTQEHTTALANHLTSNASLFSDFISLATKPSAKLGPPRERYKHPWVVASLVRHGPPVLRQALARNPDLVRNLASVFDAPQGQLQPPLATHVCDILRVVFHEFPKESATALYHTQIVPNLVRHIHLQPVAELLPRLVGARVFTSLVPAPVIPGHKRFVALLGKAKVQTALAERYLASAKAVFAGDQEAIPAVEGCCNAMAEISFRAMSLPRKPEDHNERDDAGYAGNLLIVPAHVYNDSKDHMDLFLEPKPLLDILSHALNHSRDNHNVLLPTLTMAIKVIQGLRQSRSSSLPTVRKRVLGHKTSPLGKVLVSLRGEIANLLSEGDRIVGRKRLAAVDLLHEACATLEEESVDDLLCADDFKVLRAMLDLVLAFRRNEMLLVAVSHTLGCFFDNFHGLASRALRETPLSSILHELRTETSMESALASLVSCQGMDHVMQDGTEGLKRQLSALEEYYDEHVKEKVEEGLVKGSDLTQSSITEELAHNLELEGELSTSEDYPQEVYINGLLHEIGEPEKKTPPSESILGHSSHDNDVANIWNKGLTRLKDHAHHHKHQLYHHHHHHSHKAKEGSEE